MKLSEFGALAFALWGGLALVAGLPMLGAGLIGLGAVIMVVQIWRH